MSISAIRISGPLAPLADADNYPVTLEDFHAGGYRTVPDITDRDQIPSNRLKVGQLVRVQNLNQAFRLQSITPLAWVQVDLEGTAALAEASEASDAAASAQEDADGAKLVASGAQITADSAKTTAETASAAAAAAQSAANAALAAAAGFPVVDFLGTITTLGQDPGAASGLSGKWWQIGVAGTLTHANAGGLTVAVGDRLLSNGTIWKQYIQSPTYIPAGSVTKSQMSFNAQAQYGQDDNYVGWLRVVITPAGVLGYGVKTDGTFIAKLPIGLGTANGLTWVKQAGGNYVLSLGSTEGILPIGTQSQIREDPDYPSTLWALMTPTGHYGARLKSDGTFVIPKAQILSGLPDLGTPQELIDARGSKASLDERLDVFLDEAGYAKTAASSRDLLRETRQRLMSIDRAQSTAFVWAAIGDSWTQAGFRYIEPMTFKLRTRYGSSGAGWVGFGNSSSGPQDSADALHARVTARTGLFGSNATANYTTQNSPDCAGVVSNAVNDQVTVTFANTYGDATTVSLHYRTSPGAGTFEYRFNSGSWVSQSTNGTEGSARLGLAGIPTGAWTMDVRVASGSVTLYGCDIRCGTGKGLVVHKLGNSGARASRFTALDATAWQGGLTALGPSLVTVLLGTNDQAGGIGGPTYRTDLGLLLTRIKVAVPTADILVIAPCENGLGISPTMTEYTAVARDLAASNGAAFLDLQQSFGPSFATYSSASSRPWFASDNVHPTQAGGYAIGAALNQLLDFD